MKKLSLLLALATALIFGAQGIAQTAGNQVVTQELSFIKTAHGKGEEWVKLMRDVSAKRAQVLADEGKIISWTLLRSVYPAGDEARATYMISQISAGNPKSMNVNNEEIYKKAGIAMTPKEFYAKRTELSHLVASELWRPQIYNGAAQKGNYMTVNMMKVKNAAKYDELEHKIWSPISLELIKRGAMTGWLYSTKMMPTGSETAYSAMTVDMYPSLEAVFADRNFDDVLAKAHPGKDSATLFNEMAGARDLARRELWTVVERVTKKQ